jgi:Zn-dependent peptidase ImmA (M78 family)
VSPRTIANYEDGTSTPGGEVVQRFSDILAVPATFFSGPPTDEVSVGAVSFRALSKMSAIRRDSALASGSIAIEVNRWLEERMHMPPSEVPTYERAASDPDTAAQRLRFEWELGYARIPNVVHLLEAHGVRVFSLPEHLSEVDAFSFWWQGVPFVLLNTRKSYERGRFDAAHELGHLVMHSEYDLPRGRERELEANRFAAALLMPEEDVLARGLRNAGPDRVLGAKGRWGVAAMALTHRLHELGLTSDWTYTSTCRRLAQMGYRSGEPDSANTPRETSLVLEKAFSLLKDRGIRHADVAAAIRIHPETLRELLFGLIMTPVSGVATAATGSTANLRLLPGGVGAET